MIHSKLGRRQKFGFLVMVAIVCLSCFTHSSAVGALYECTDGSGSRIFTDRPAQLQRCTAMPTNQSSSAQAPQVAAPVPYQNALPATIDPPPAPFTAPADRSTPPPGSVPVVPQPCTPGFNPLNPLAAPPCHQTIPGQAGAAPPQQSY
jgi:uncharacterized protein DUF4124